MRRIVFDLETDGFIETVTKIHCLCWYDIDTKESNTCIDYDHMRTLIRNCEVVIGHNIVRFDIPILEKFLEEEVKAKKIDTLGLSWYLYPNRFDHGIKAWGRDLGIEKVKIEDWKEGTLESYIIRCKEDRRINVKVWEYQLAYLKRIYSTKEAADRLIGYLSYKLECAREMEEVKWRLDIDKCKANLEFLEKEAQSKTKILSKVMPPNLIYKVIAKPKIPFKKDGTVSEHGKKWFNLLKERDLPDYHNGALEILDKTLEGNPKSFNQIKEWLFSLGWKPITFKYVKSHKGIFRDKVPTEKDRALAPTKKIPQISNDDSSDICDSVKELYSKEPKLEELEGLFILNHRISILKGFLESVNSDGFIKAEISGFTNTLRFQHRKPIVNLPTIPKKYWEMVRGVLIAPDKDHLLCGSDMSGLEDQTGRHYIYYYDPEYVNELKSEEYDPHLDIAVRAGLVIEQRAELYKFLEKKRKTQKLETDEEDIYSKVKTIRLKAKKTNFSAKYGAFPPKIALTAGISLDQAKILFDTYWQRNKAIKDVIDNTQVKKIDTQMWLYNPVSQFWYTLRADKDKFSTLNQSTGVYCFDTWIRYIRKSGIKICSQYHDEIVFPISKGYIGGEEHVKYHLNKAIKETNEELKLNVTLGISIDFGYSYAEIH